MAIWPSKFIEILPLLNATHRELAQIKGEMSRSKGQRIPVRLCVPFGFTIQEQNDVKESSNLVQQLSTCPLQMKLLTPL